MFLYFYCFKKVNLQCNTYTICTFRSVKTLFKSSFSLNKYRINTIIKSGNKKHGTMYKLLLKYIQIFLNVRFLFFLKLPTQNSSKTDV